MTGEIRTSPRRSPTMVDVARVAGVSPATVSYVISGRRGESGAARISDETRLRVLHAMEDIGYAINETARSLRRNRTDRVLLLIDRLASPYEQRLASELEEAFLDSGRSLSIMVCATLERLEAALRLLHQRLADGAVVESRTISGVQSLLERTAPVSSLVAISTSLKPSGFDVVFNDEVPAIEEGLQHLLASGHRRIGYIAHDLRDESEETRLPVVRHFLERAGPGLSPDRVVAGARDRVAAYAAARSLLGRPDPPTAIVSASDIGAISTIWAAKSLGLDVPKDIAVIGVGNIDEGTITVPTLSSVGPVGPDFTQVAALLNERLETTTALAGRRLTFPWHFVRRGST